MSEIKELTKRIHQFVTERDWKKFHNHKDLALSLMIEAAELLEHFQWKNEEEAKEAVKKNKEAIAEEIGDVAIYLLELADNLSIDLNEAIIKKIEKNSKKYPIQKSKGNHAKYNQF